MAVIRFVVKRLDPHATCRTSTTVQTARGAAANAARPVHGISATTREIPSWLHAEPSMLPAKKRNGYASTSVASTDNNIVQNKNQLIQML